MGEGSVRLPGGVSATPLPAGWRVLKVAPLTLEGPERDLELTFLVTERGAAAEVAAKALALVQPGRAARILNAVEVPAASGWDAVQQAAFDASATPGTVLMSFHYLLGDKAHVVIADGARAAFDRRMAQIAEILDSWRPPGRSEETLAGREAVWDAARSEALDSFIRSGLARNGVPGASVAVVLRGRAVHAAGYGVTELGGSEAVTSQTRFRIGSTTKALTTLMMAGLVERGLFGWETPVCALSPGFALADPTLTREMRMRHTVNASTGMPRRDLALLFRFGGVTPEQRMAELQGMAPTTGFGEVFQYSNHLVALGGYVAAKAAFPGLDLSSAYDRAMQELVLGPLGMGASSIAGAAEAPTAAACPHALDLDGAPSPIADWLEHFVEAVAPAGAVWSTADDLAKYLALELSGGTLPDGRRLMPAEALANRRSGGVKITDTEAYGLGLMCNTKLGRALLHHGGNTLGFTSDMFFLPEAEIGAAVLANLGAANGFREAVRRRILELAFGLDEKAEALMAGAAEASASTRRSRRERVLCDQAAADWLAQFVGDYENPALGALKIRRREASVWAEFVDFAMELGMEVREDVRWISLISPPLSGGLSLRPSADGAGLVLPGGQEEHLFQRV